MRERYGSKALKTTMFAGAALLSGLLVMGAAPPAAAPDGADLFAQNCAACHQPAGQGIAGAFPALAGNTFVQGPAPIVASTVLKGRAGMPSFSSDLTDDQIAAVLTYVRASWGNHAAAIPTATVAAARGGSAADEKSVLPGH